jgi:hypothetical protein
MPDTQDAVEFGGKYQEDENFVPEPTAQFGTLDTSGTAGAAHSRIEEISPVFEVADALNAQAAAKAVEDGDFSQVILPTGQQLVTGDPDAAKEAVLAKAKDTEPVLVASSRKTPPLEDAEEEGDEAAAKAEAQQTQQGAGSRGTDGSGTGTTTGDSGSGSGSGTKSAKASAQK